MQKFTKIKLLIFIFCASLIIVRYYHISILDVGYGKTWYHGDAYSDLNVQSAAMHYKDNGLSSNNFLPLYNVQDTIPNNEYIYKHYPPLAEWIGGITAIITGSTSELSLSIFPLLLSLILFFLIYKILADIIQKPLESFVAATCIVLSNYYLGWASDFHQHVYIELCRWLFVWLWWKYLNVSAKKYYILILAFLYACMCWVSFEAYVYIAIVIVGFSYVYQSKIIRWEHVILLLVPVGVFGLRLYLNYLNLHTWEAVVHDFKYAYETRIGADQGYSELGRAMTWQDYIYLLPKTRIHRLGHFFIFPSLVIIYLSILGLVQIKKYNIQIFKMALVVYIASLSWSLVMSQHALIHIFTIRHLGVFIGLVLGFGLVQYKNNVFNAIANKWSLKIVLHSIIILYSVIYIGINSVYYLYLKYGFAYPHLGVESYEINHFLF